MKKYRNYIIAALIFIAVCVTVCFIPINATKLIPTVEKQVEEKMGIKIHIEKLILRLGPSLKVKAPVMHMMYEDGQKFGQFDNIRIFIPWTVLIKDDIKVKRIYADNLIVKLSSTDSLLPALIEKFKSKDFNENPDLLLKKYSIYYKDTAKNKLYKTDGNMLALTKLANIKNFKVNAEGNFYIDDKKYITYDVSFLPNVNIPENIEQSFDFNYYLDQIQEFDFHSDIIADIKLYNNINDEQQISGLINVDNMSVLDSENKNPKSFIYLTFLGNKIGILSNVYSAGNKKVCIDGMINNSKKPEIDVKVKTDEIYLDDLYKKLKLIADFSGLKMIEKLNGKLVADFTLKGDLKKVKSTGYMKISDASIKANGIDIKNINSDIDFSNNEISIKNAVGYVNEAPILLKGKIGSKLDLELLMSKVQLKHLCPATFGINNGILSLGANITGTFENIIHKENILVDDFKLIHPGYNISFSNLKLDTNKENIAYINNLQLKTQNTEVIKLPQVKLNILSDTIKIPETNIFMPNSKMKMKADISSYNSSNFTFNFNLDGFINSKDIHTAYTGNYPLKIRLNGNKDLQNIEGQVQLEKAVFLDEPAIINLSAKAENNTLKIEDLSVTPFNGKFSNNFKANLKAQKKIVISGNIENLESPNFKNIRIFIPQQINLTVNDTIAQLRGDVFINGKYNQPEIIGQLSAQSIINQFLQLAVNNMTIDFNKNVAIINAPMIKIADTTMTANSTVSTDISKELVIKNTNIKSKYINTDTILMYKDNPIMNLIPYKVIDGKLFAERATLSLYGSPLNMSALNTEFNIKDNILNAKNISSELLNGKLAGKIEYNLKDDSFKTKMQSRGVSAAPIFDIIAIKKDSVSGTMDFDLDLSGNIMSKQSLNGNIKFIVHNGRMGTLGKLEHLLYAQNVIADSMLRTSLSVVTKAITLKDTGLFKYLRGDITMKNGVADINMLQSQGPLMALYVKGQYHPLNDYAKLIVLGRLSDEVVSGLGAFGDFSLNKLMIMLSGEENNKFNIRTDDLEKLPQLPMRNTKEFRSIINGTLEKPSSVLQFNWISYSQKSLRQKDVPMTNVKVPDFIEALPY